MIYVLAAGLGFLLSALMLSLWGSPWLVMGVGVFFVALGLGLKLRKAIPAREELT